MFSLVRSLEISNSNDAAGALPTLIDLLDTFTNYEMCRNNTFGAMIIWSADFSIFAGNRYKYVKFHKITEFGWGRQRRRKYNERQPWHSIT